MPFRSSHLVNGRAVAAGQRSQGGKT